MYDAKTYAINRLREVANKLRSPEMAMAFGLWQDEWRTEQQLALQDSAERASRELDHAQSRNKFLEDQLVQTNKDFTQKLTEMAEQMRIALERQRTELVGTAAEKAAMMEEQSKEERIELLRRQIGRRMMNQGIIRGWSAWQEMYDAKTYAMNKLREVGSKLRSPEMAMAFSKWLDLYQEHLDRQLMSEAEKREAELAEERARHAAELDQLKSVYEVKLASASDEKLAALDRLRIELAGTTEERMALEEAKAKEERIELLRRQVGRRMMNQGIIRGWQAWLEMYEAKTYALNKLRHVATRLLMQEQFVAFANWVHLWQAKQSAKEERAQRRALATVESQLSQATFEVGQLKMFKMAHEDEIKALKEKHHLDEAAIQQRDDAIARLKPLSQAQRKRIEELEEKLESWEDTASVAEGERDKAREQAREQHAANQELMERLLAEQRTSFEEDKVSAKAELAEAVTLQEEIRAEYEKQAAEALDEHQTYARQSREEAAALEASLNDVAVQLRTMTGERDTLTNELSVLKEKLDSANKEAAEAKDEMAATRALHADAHAEVKSLQAQLLKMQSEKPAKKASSTLGGVKLDPNAEVTVAQQIAAALRSAASRVLDLLREWDTDGDGEISRAEFHKAMEKMGLEAPKKDIDELFSEWDADGGGTLEYKELSKILTKAKSANIAASAPGSAKGAPKKK